MRPLVCGLIALLVAVLGLLTCVIQVDETEYVIIARFGDPRRA